MFFPGSVFPAQSRCPAFTLYFTFICVLWLLSKYIREPCQILLKPHPLDVPAELSPLSKLAVYSGVQLEMQINKFWGLILFGIRKDPEAKGTLKISQLLQAGACTGGEEQLQRAGGAQGRGASSLLGGRDTSVRCRPPTDRKDSSKGVTTAACAFRCLARNGSSAVCGGAEPPGPSSMSRKLTARLPSVPWTRSLPGCLCRS